MGVRGQVSYPATANVIRLNGRTILPGLIDGHVHLRDYQLPMFLPYGVTTIADIHNDTAWSIAQREALKSGAIKGPRLFVSGARVTGPLGAPTKDGSFVRTAEEARAYVRSLKAAGVDHVKVDLTITDDQLRAVIEEANAAGLRVLGHTQNIRKDPNLAFVPADVKAAWTREPGRARAGYANVAAFLSKYSEAGGKVLAATDTGCCTQIVPGLSLHYEMQMLTDIGITPMKAIQGATLWAAEVIGQQRDLGSIEPGKLADFTIIEGNPLADIGATKNVRMVIKGGEVMDTTYDPRWVNPIPRRVGSAPPAAR